jgi:hypothetical protein
VSHRGEHCLNCGALTPDAYCGHCGQRNADYRESMREVVGEVAEEIFQLDSRIAKTIVPFLFQPGRLTKEFVEGRRVRYSSPLRLFLFTSALYFVAGWLAPGRAHFLEWSGSAQKRTVELWPTERPDAGADDAKPLFYADDDGGLLDERPDGGESRFAAFQRERVDEWRKEPGNIAKQRMSEFVIASVPKAVFVLMPLFALLLALFFRKPKRFYLEHFIFALHYHSFLFVVMAIGQLIHSLEGALGLAAVVYLALSLRRVYSPTVVQLTWKLILLVLLYAIILLSALALLGFAAFEFA